METEHLASGFAESAVREHRGRISRMGRPYRAASIRGNDASCSTSTSAHHARAGFTLIEVVVVVVVIGLLAGLVAPNVFRNLGVARESTAQSQGAMLAAALDAYRLDSGRYPSTEQGLDALWVAPTLPPMPRNWAGPYLRRQPPLDPWNNPYLYSLDGDGRFHLTTLGADGREGGEGEDADLILW
jgi:general secretion pathway protein G